jgi:hypothetical protein
MTYKEENRFNRKIEELAVVEHYENLAQMLQLM